MAPPQERMRLTFDDYVLVVGRRELWRGSQPIAVEPQVFDLLVYLVQNPDRVVSKDELLEAVWHGRIVSESAITNRINAARRAIGDSGQAQRLIRTVPREGFRFVGAIKEHSAEPAKAAVPPVRGRSRATPPIFAASVSALLSAAIAAFFLWPRTGPPGPLAIGTHSERAPIIASAGEPHLTAGSLLTAADRSADRLSLSANLADLSWAQALFVTSASSWVAMSG